MSRRGASRLDACLHMHGNGDAHAYVSLFVLICRTGGTCRSACCARTDSRNPPRHRRRAEQDMVPVRRQHAQCSSNIASLYHSCSKGFACAASAAVVVVYVFSSMATNALFTCARSAPSQLFAAVYTCLFRSGCCVIRWIAYCLGRGAFELEKRQMGMLEQPLAVKETHSAGLQQCAYSCEGRCRGALDAERGG